MIFRQLLCLLASLALLPYPVAGQEPVDTVDARIQEALQTLEAGDLEQGIEILEALRGESLAQPPVLGLLGALYLEAGNPLLAFETLEPLAQLESPDPAVLYNAGRAAMALNRPQAAESFWSRSLELEPQSPAVRELGMLRAAQGRYREAYRLLRPWASASPEDHEARIVTALCAVQLQRPSEAETLLTDISKDPPRVRLLWGRVQLDMGDPKASIETLEPLLQDPPATMEMDIRRTLAKGYSSVGRAADAARILEGHVGTDASVALQLAQAQYLDGDLESAISTLGPFASQSLTELTEGQEPAAVTQRLLAEQGRLLLTAGRHGEALPYLEHATRLNPEDKQSWQQVGQALAVAGRIDEAREALEKFQQIAETEVPPSVSEAQTEKDLADPTGRALREAIRLIKDERYDVALEILRREMQIAPEDIRTVLLESRILLLSGRLDEALTSADRALAMAPENADGHYQRGAVLIASDRLDTAEAELLQALEILPQHTPAMNDLAVLYMNSGRKEEARQLLERALELRPNDAMAAANLQKLDLPIER